jgi:O-antigen/teichoic acid export membrane protein
LTLFEQSVNIVVGPVVSELVASKQKAKLQKLASQAVLQVALPAIFCSVILSISSEFVLSLLGNGFSEAQGPLIILLLGRAVLMAVGPADTFLSLGGHEKISMRVALFCIVLSIGLMTIGGMIWQAEGIAMASILSELLRKLMYWVSCRHLLEVKSDLLSALFFMTRKSSA